MYKMLSLYINMKTQCLVKNITAEWTLSIMYKRMYFQFTLMTQCFLKHARTLSASVHTLCVCEKD